MFDCVRLVQLPVANLGITQMSVNELVNFSIGRCSKFSESIFICTANHTHCAPSRGTARFGLFRSRRGVSGENYICDLTAFQPKIRSRTLFASRINLRSSFGRALKHCSSYAHIVLHWTSVTKSPVLSFTCNSRGRGTCLPVFLPACLSANVINTTTVTSFAMSISWLLGIARCLSTPLPSVERAREYVCAWVQGWVMERVCTRAHSHTHERDSMCGVDGVDGVYGVYWALMYSTALFFPVRPTTLSYSPYFWLTFVQESTQFILRYGQS